MSERVFLKCPHCNELSLYEVNPFNSSCAYYDCKECKKEFLASVEYEPKGKAITKA